jgi:integrase
MTNLAYNIERIGYNYIVDEFESWLKTLSKNTAKNYKSDIELFCNVVFGKELKFVTVEELENLKTLHANRFYAYLKYEQNAKNSTIKRRFNSVKSFLKQLKRDYKKINVDALDIKLESEKIDRQGWGNISWKEAEMLWKYAGEKQIEGHQMEMLIKLACVTSIRLEALLSLEWEKHFFVKNERGIDVNYIDVVDKTKRHKKSISDKFYNELREKLGTTGKLFPNLHAQKARDYLKEILDDLGFDERRNISFHSLKKCGVNRVLEKTGNLHKAKEQGNHSSIATTEDYYIEIQEDLTQMASYTLDEEIDIVKELKDVSRDDLISAIAQMSDSAKFELLRIINGATL